MAKIVEPIAVVGLGAVLPGALSPQALWEAVAAGRELLTGVPEGIWPVPVDFLVRPKAPGKEAAPYRGGFVTGFEAGFDPSGLRLDRDFVKGADRSLRWLLDAGRQAVRDHGRDDLAGLRGAVVLGNLSYPTRTMTDLAYRATAGAARGLPLPEPEAWEHRFVSGRPAQLLAEALGITGPAFALDAACASSLYAVKLACDYLRDGTADVAIAAGINGFDNIFLHIGFEKLGALSPSGNSRPFSTAADGLLPAEGAAALVLKRLDDAVRAGDRVHAVIRGVGLSNDGRRGGLLAPDQGGQIRAIRSAYAESGIDPRDVSLLECHATGTPTGDRNEIESLKRVFAGATDLPVGSVKSNLGHLITVAGMAAIIKVIGAMKAQRRPRTLNIGTPIREFDGSPLRPLFEDEAWPATGPRLAAISNFGFGGNNAHLIVEEYVPARTSVAVSGTGGLDEDSAERRHPRRVVDEEIVICGIGVVAGNARGLDALAFADAAVPTATAELPLRGLAFPPNDLARTAGQHTVVLETALAAIRGVKLPEATRAGVFIGMGTDFEPTRAGVILRAEHAWTEGSAPSLSIEELRERIGGLSTKDVALGTMPNLPANRISVQLDLRGPGFTVSSEELSGVTALELAARLLRNGTLDFALAGAVDLSTEQIHNLACANIPALAGRVQGDGAIVLALKRRIDAERDGDPIIASIAVDHATKDDGASASYDAGDPHAAAGLFEIGRALAAQMRRRHDVAAALADRKGGAPHAAIDARVLVRPEARLAIRTAHGWRQEVRIGHRDLPETASDAPHLLFAAADSLEELGRRLGGQEVHMDGRLRIAIVATDADMAEKRRAYAIARLEAGAPPAGPGILFGDRRMEGEIALTFPSYGSQYEGMVRETLTAFPDIVERQSIELGLETAARCLKLCFSDLAQLNGEEVATLSSVAGLCGATIVRSVLGVEPHAYLGISMGETNMLTGAGLWSDAIQAVDELNRENFLTEVFRPWNSPLRYLGLSPDRIDWRNYDVTGPVEEVERAIADGDHAWITIITAPEHCILSGNAPDCERVIARLPRHRTSRQAVDIALHGPFSASYAETYRRTHNRAFLPGVTARVYFNACHKAVAPDRERFAELLGQQTMERIDFRRTVLQAWQDGVRIFIQMGPRNALSGAIQRTLGERPHLTVSMDNATRGGLVQTAHAAAELFVHGVPCRIDGLARRLARLRGEAAAQPERTISVPAHQQEIALPHLTEATQAARARNLARTTEAAESANEPIDLARYREAERQRAASLALMRRPPQRVADADTLRGEVIDLILVAEQRASASMRRRGGAIARPAAAPAVASMAARSASMSMAASASPSSVSAAQRGPAMTKTVRLPIHAAAGAPTPLAIVPPSGLKISREQLEFMARDKISAVFGPLFAQQDGYARQCRMPAPPLLLADRVTGIAGEPGSMGKGICWTETDVRSDRWYIEDGRMPVGILIESGQADLLLISWLGADFLNRGERVYRLLGCEMTFHEGGMPKIGETIAYQIHIDAHAKVGDTRLFFFRYDARVNGRLACSIREGQAGFFSDAELAGSAGVLWSAEEDMPKADARLDPAPRVSRKRRFSAEEVRAFAEGRAFDCFGEGFEFAAPHQRTPKIPGGRMQMIDRVTAFDPAGGPWGRGYLRAESDVPPDAWFYSGHFHNDPCMPGTLMAEAAAQALSFHIAALGFTIDRDGWRFEPTTGTPFKFLCRGQVIPDGPHLVTYEVFVEEIIDGEQPTLYAALLAKSDGLKVFLCRRFGIRLVRDYPLRDLDRAPPATRRIVSPTGDVPGDYDALLACANGRPANAFGSMYAHFDVAGSAPRLPTPPYHFMSSIVSVDCPPAKPTPGGRVRSTYDVPADAWYFADGGNGAMPFSVLSEVVLQPCGWLASYMGFAIGHDVKFRNLDGSEVAPRREVTARTGTLTIDVTFVKHAKLGSMVIVYYDVICRAGEEVIITLQTNFGFFPPESLASQKGLAATEERRAALSAPSPVTLGERGRAILAGTDAPRLPSGRLALAQDIAGFWPEGGAAGLGRIVARQQIDPTNWYFKAHFFSDPVQPGSLGLEALFTALKTAAKLKNLHARFQRPRFQAPALGEAIAWTYRGQVVPSNRLVLSEMEITAVVDEGSSVLVRGAGSLWCDGLRIYEVKGFAIRILEDDGSTRAPLPGHAIRLDRATAPWLADHCPTYVIPAFPMLGTAGLLLRLPSQSDQPATRVDHLEMRGWLIIGDEPLVLEPRSSILSDGRERVVLTRDGQPVASGFVTRGAYEPAPAPWESQFSGDVMSDPYGDGGLFHDGAFQMVDRVIETSDASVFEFDVAEAFRRAGDDPTIMLDVIVHGVPHSRPWLWYGPATEKLVTLPYRLEQLTLYRPLPRSGRARVVTHALGMPTARTVRYGVQMQVDGQVALDLTMVGALLRDPFTPTKEQSQRRAFCQSGRAVPSQRVSKSIDGRSLLKTADYEAANWLPGTVETIYRIADAPTDKRQKMEIMAIKEHLGARYGLHPSRVVIDGAGIRPGDHPAVPLAALRCNWLDNETFEVSDA